MVDNLESNLDPNSISKLKQAEKKPNISNQSSKGASLSLNLNPHDSVFVNNISYLSQVFYLLFYLHRIIIELELMNLFFFKLSYLNLIDNKNEELCRYYQHNIKKLTNKKPIKLYAFFCLLF